MASELSRYKAAQAWCTEETKHIEMDTALAEAFANILDEIWSKPWLGNATTQELVDELQVRIQQHPLSQYRTVDGG